MFPDMFPKTGATFPFLIGLVFIAIVYIRFEEEEPINLFGAKFEEVLVAF